MHLKRLEIQGFKSFADKVDFHFTDGVTIVVGPNGSGKSNISDSIRWVLGEQSAKSLRGAKMEDVIFAGSDRRRPVGMAAVSMTMDNSDGTLPLEYNEVTVTRRVYRSGDSEFLINKVPCRLRDIHELFMDTGIGKETYSIISQGKVEEILSAKPEERRNLIEEAAGIVKYRSRKHEALRKLEDTQQNLNRVGDIINELESQVEPLAEQAERAKAYQEFHQELVGLEINLMVHQLEEQKQRLTEALTQAAKLSQELLGSETISRQLEAQLEELRLQAALFDEEVSRFQQVVFDVATGIERTESEIKLAEERAKGLEDQLLHLDREITEGQTKTASVDSEYAVELGRASVLSGQVNLIATKLQASEKAFAEVQATLANEEQAVEDSKGDIIELLNQIAVTRNELAGLESSMSGYRRREEQLTLARGEKQTKHAVELKRLDQLKSEVEQVRTNLVLLHQVVGEKGSLQKEQEAKLEGVREELKKAQGFWQAQQSRHKVLQELQQHYEGYQKGVREVLLGRQKAEHLCQDVCGVVAELVKVPKEYEIAIELALGGTLQNIVTTTDEGAKQAIAYLKTHNLGRATFLPLNTIKAQQLRSEDEQALKMPGAIGVAAQLVKCEPRYQAIVNNLLGRIILVENIDQAVKIAQATNYRIRLVTLDGDVINPGGSLTGGSYHKRGSNLLGRARELAELEKTLTTVSQQVAEFQDLETVITENIQTAASAQEEINGEIQLIQIKLAELERDIFQCRQEKERLEKSLELQAIEEEQIAQQLTATLERQDELLDLLACQEEQYTKTQQQVVNQQEETKKAGEIRITLQEELTSLKVDLATLRQEEQGLKQSIQRYQQNRKQLEQEIAQRQALTTELSNRRLELLQGVDQYRLQLQEQVLELKRKEEELNNRRTEKANLASAVILKEKELKAKQQSLAGLQQEIHSIEVRQARLEAEVEGGTTRLWDEYQLSYEQALLEKKDIANRRAVITRINQLKADINTLGVINLGSIEEYTRVKERYEFLLQQSQDLNQAKDALYRVINEMNQIMTDRFAEAFQAINTNFTEVFNQLFGGGRAELVLTDCENLLETGLEIIAQPPGKKPQYLSLLSGGERALTAIALLFAILKVKPSPFCVLDEIEASLDEANVRRFADFVKEFSRKTQFIVVTHRKGTMEVADVLYGVTMDETGISKVVSMRFSEETKQMQAVST